MKKNVCYTMVGALFLLSQSCDYYDARLMIHNDTKRTLAIQVYEDTVPDFPSMNMTEFYLNHTVVSGATYNNVLPEKSGWEKIIYRSKNKKLNLFIYEVDSLHKYKSIDTLIKYRIYKYYTYSKEELIKDNWAVKIDFK
jgi:hypothetical protein